jgi:hypothetical protein
MKRRPLSMKRLTHLTAHYCISLGMEDGTAEMERLLKFLDYVWKNKDNELQPLYFPSPTK